MTAVQTPPANLGPPRQSPNTKTVAMDKLDPRPKPGDEQVFRRFSDEEAANYAQLRNSYSDNLYRLVTSYYTNNTSVPAPSTTPAGKIKATVVDVGCGPGIATFQLADYFDKVIGLDPGQAMINTARARLAAEKEKGSAENIRFELSTAEDIDPALIPDESVDVITAATCAHVSYFVLSTYWDHTDVHLQWFDMTRFWPSAARILRPGGTVAIWCGRPLTAHSSVPNAAKVNAAWDEIRQQELEPYLGDPGSLIARARYQTLGLPWTVDPPVPAFDQATFYRKLFGGEGDNDQKTPFFAADDVSFDCEYSVTLGFPPHQATHRSDANLGSRG